MQEGTILTVKLLADELYELYRDCYNNHDEVRVPLLQQHEVEHFYQPTTVAEVWMYRRDILITVDETEDEFIYFSERNISRKEFIIAAVMPLYQIFVKDKKEDIFFEDLYDFALEKGLFRNIFSDNLQKISWRLDTDCITVADSLLIMREIKKQFK